MCSSISISIPMSLASSTRTISRRRAGGERLMTECTVRSSVLHASLWNTITTDVSGSARPSTASSYDFFEHLRARAEHTHGASGPLRSGPAYLTRLLSICVCVRSHCVRIGSSAAANALLRICVVSASVMYEYEVQHSLFAPPRRAEPRRTVQYR